MKKIFITIAIFSFIIITSKISAQKFIGVKGGISIPNLTAGGSEENELNSGYSSIIGPNFAVFFETGLSKRFSLSTQLEYSAQGGKKNGFQAFPNPFTSIVNAPYLYADFNSKAKINYLMLSELAKVNFPLGSSPFSFYVEVGPFAGLLMSAHEITSGKSDVYADKQQQVNLTQQYNVGQVDFNNNENIKDQVHKGNFGIEGDVGFAYNFGMSKVFVEGGGNYGFLNIQKGTDNGKNNIGAATIRIGYAINFGGVGK